MIGEALQKQGWTEADLKCRQKGEPVKVRLARKPKDETTMTLKWMADRLCMCKWTHVSNLLRKRPANENQLELNECQ